MVVCEEETLQALDIAWSKSVQSVQKHWKLGKCLMYVDQTAAILDNETNNFHDGNHNGVVRIFVCLSPFPVSREVSLIYVIALHYVEHFFFPTRSVIMYILPEYYCSSKMTVCVKQYDHTLGKLLTIMQF